MREPILAIRAFWDCWQNDTRLNFRGEFYKLTLMSPFFNPGPHNYPNIPIHIAGVNKLMCQLAGELCQGLHIHSFHTQQYLEQVILPNVHQGLQKSGRQRQDIELISTIFVIPTDDPTLAANYTADTCRQIAFYASTPSYLHGWADTAQQLERLAARRKWDEMPALITGEMLNTFTVQGTWAELPGKVQAKYNGLLDRVSYYFPPFVPGENDDIWQATVAGFKG